ncbi:FUSC family protein [Microbacterium sp. STN6]|uniref:FUSC family protein n=1 Tax=Microbacterium sp. STN6 TaxID=2995588 RepID=UPI002260DB36|nr:FUSC family protein [Microbacterium sp. STN6]MCX7522282.1 FUSC family protein [Microbacterium sp. STN6]
MRLTTTVRSARRVPIIQVVKVAIATVAAWLICLVLLPGQLPIFATIAALLVVQPSVNQSFGKAVERSLGVIVGVLVAYGVGLVFGQQSWIVLAAIVVAIFVGWALKLTPGSANQVPISAMLVLSIGAATPNYAFDRIIETVIGALIGVIVNVAIVPPVLLAPAHQAVTRLADEIAATLDRLAETLSTPRTNAQLEEMLLTARLLRPMQAKADAALTQGEESLRLNPRRSRVRDLIEADRALFVRLGPLVTRALGMTRALHDHYDVSLLDEPAVGGIASELGRAAHDLRLLAKETERAAGRSGRRGDAREGDEPPATTAELPALTAPLSIGPPRSTHWILIGSLMEDLRRVREEIVGD